MHRIVPEQGGTLDDLLVAVAPGHDGPQAQLLTLAGLFHQFAGGDPADAAETVEHHVLRFKGVLVLPDEAIQDVPEEVAHAGGLGLGGQVLVRQAPDVDLGRGQVHLQHGLRDVGGCVDVDGLSHDLLRVVEEVDHLGDGDIEQVVPEEHQLHALLVHESADRVQDAHGGLLAVHVILQSGLVAGLGFQGLHGEGTGNLVR